jgi:ERCC4-type nuclease
VSPRFKPPPLHILIDSREKTAFPLPDGVTWEVHGLREGDYATRKLLPFARCERKSVGDYSSSISHEADRFDREMIRLRAYRWRFVIVEGSLREFAEVGRVSLVHFNAIVGSVCSLYARHGVPTFFADTPETAGRMLCGIFRRLEEECAKERRPFAAYQTASDRRLRTKGKAARKALR